MANIRTLFVCIVLTLLSAGVHADVGYFSPGGIPSDVVSKTQFGLINAVTPEQLDRKLNAASGTAFKVYVDLGQAITVPAGPAKLSMSYKAPGGAIRNKVFAPQENSKIIAFLPDKKLRKVLDPLIAVLKKHSANVGAVFLADEPYLNGLSKAEMERVGRIVRRELDLRGLKRVKLGVVFASAMFDSKFAHLIDLQSSLFASGIDDYVAKGGDGNAREFAAWKEKMKQHRLATYDRAGNMYTGGGLPRGFDLVGFDFYLSTVLLDGIYEQSLAWFAKYHPSGACSQFAGKPMAEIRSALSFFRDGPVLHDATSRSKDKLLLDAIYQCRIGAVTSMLKSESGKKRVHLFLISESSNNGVLNFNSDGVPVAHQSESLVQSRVLDEVVRAEHFYKSHACVFDAGLMFFTYSDSYDQSIKLHVGGAAAMPLVLDSISHFAQANGKSARCSSL